MTTTPDWPDPDPVPAALEPIEPPDADPPGGHATRAADVIPLVDKEIA